MSLLIEVGSLEYLRHFIFVGTPALKKDNQGMICSHVVDEELVL